LHQAELGSADPIQLNGCGYTADDGDWSSHAQLVGQLQWHHHHTQCLRNSPVPIGCNLFRFYIFLKLLHNFCINSWIIKFRKDAFCVPIVILLLFLRVGPLSRYMFTSTAHQHSRMLFIYPLVNSPSKKTTENR